MNVTRIQIPEGVQDYLPVECYHKNEIENIFKNTFYISGYSEVETPGFEYYDVFENSMGSINQERMIKFFDTNGKILVLRPDITTPIARLAATRLKCQDLPIRLYYVDDVYRNEPNQTGGQRDFTQAGIELLGEKNPDADAEVISIAISCLKNVGLDNFKIDIGQVEFFKGLVEECGFDEDQTELLRQYVDQKNMYAVESFLEKLNISKELQQKILKLPSLYGGPDVLKIASDMTTNKKCRDAIENINYVYEILNDYNLSHYITIDLGMVQSLNYYTGVIFRGITDNFGFPILGGGRYDKLVGRYGNDMPATGFAAGIKRILMALEQQNKLGSVPKSDFAVGYEEKYRSKALEFVNKLRNQQKRVEICYSKNIKDYIGSKGIKKGYFFNRSGSIDEYENQEDKIL